MDDGAAILVRQEGLGAVGPEDREFALAMFDRFIHTLEGQSPRPRAICFYTEGVKLLGRGSPAVLGLSLLEGLGVKLLACKTCLEHYGLTDRLAIGEAVGMNDILKVLLEAAKVITV